MVYENGHRRIHARFFETTYLLILFARLICKIILQAHLTYLLSLLIQPISVCFFHEQNLCE